MPFYPIVLRVDCDKWDFVPDAAPTSCRQPIGCRSLARATKVVTIRRNSKIPLSALVIRAERRIPFQLKGYPYFVVNFLLCDEARAAGWNWLPRCRRTVEAVWKPASNAPVEKKSTLQITQYWLGSGPERVK